MNVTNNNKDDDGGGGGCDNKTKITTIELTHTCNSTRNK